MIYSSSLEQFVHMPRPFSHMLLLLGKVAHLLVKMPGETSDQVNKTDVQKFRKTYDSKAINYIPFLYCCTTLADIRSDALDSTLKRSREKLYKLKSLLFENL